MFPEYIAKKKAVINPNNNNEQCFKWVVITALHHEDIEHHPERSSLLQHFEGQYNSSGLEFPLTILRIRNFERNNPGIAGNVLFNIIIHLIINYFKHII